MAHLSTQVEVFASAKNLAKRDVSSKSDPMLIFYIDGKEIGRTEHIKETHEPTWAKRFEIPFLFERKQDIRVEVYDIDAFGAKDLLDLSKHDHLGYAVSTVGNLVAAPSNTLELKLLNKQTGASLRGANGQLSTVALRSEEVKQGKHTQVTMQWSAVLPKTDLFGSTDGFLEFSRVREDGSWVLFKRLEPVKGTLKPVWAEFSLTLNEMCNGDSKRPINIKSWDWNKSGTHELHGEVTTTLGDLKQGTTLQLTRPNHKEPKQRAVERGILTLRKLEIREFNSFLDYIKAGMNVGVMVGVDFTGSNNDVSPPLHQRVYGKMNQYQEAISAVGEVLAPYDTDQQYPALGFGAVLPGSNVANHCFPLTLNPSQLEVKGVQGIMQAYAHALERVQLSGPTYFEQIIRTAASVAAQPYKPTLQHYTILLLLTDGVIMDMPKTIKAIVEASNLPLSIIIVGVGSADFTDMKALDGDTEPLNKQQSRDIVQFVPFRDFRQNGVLLAEETLREVPRQVMQFMQKHKIAPLQLRQQQQRWVEDQPGAAK